MSADDFNRHTDLKMLLHHIYEFQKGVRRLVLCTICLLYTSDAADEL